MNGPPFTEGDWQWINYPDGRKLLTGQDNAVIHCPDGPMTIGAIDQKLIEAVPQMLALIERCYRGLGRDHWEDGDTDAELAADLNCFGSAIFGPNWPDKKDVQLRETT